MRLSVIGTGYVGLVTAAIFADFGNDVWGVDIDEQKIAGLQKGRVPFFEPGLEKLVKKGLKAGRLEFTTDYQQAVPGSSIVFICVGTPAKANGDYQLDYVFKAAESIGRSLKDYAVVAIKSTVPPSTGEQVEKIIEKEASVDFDIASCPEFLREGSAIEDTLKPARVVIGVESQKAEALLLKLHQPIKAPRVVCGIKSAQMIKYAANAFLATKISFINSIARLCDAVGADVQDVGLGLGLDPRIGKQFLRPGLGYGGSCFPKDTWALIAFAKRLGYDFQFLKAVDQINQDQISYFIDKIEALCSGSVKGKTLTVLGLSFKPETDDLREARSIPLIKQLQAKGAKINAYDPVAVDQAKKILKEVEYFDDPYQALAGSEGLILVTEWPEFKDLDLERAGELMKTKMIADGRNLYDPEKVKKLGFAYKGVGRG